MHALETLELKQVFTSKELATFIACHNELKWVRLEKCYSGSFETHCADAISWVNFSPSLLRETQECLERFTWHFRFTLARDTDTIWKLLI